MNPDPATAPNLIARLFSFSDQLVEGLHTVHLRVEKRRLAGVRGALIFSRFR
jgi:hypothetical protein